MKSKKICALITLAALTTTTLFPSTSFAADAKVAPSIVASDVAVVNNFGSKDTVTITKGKVTAGYTVNVYKDAKKTTKLGSATAADDSDVSISVSLSAPKGTVYMTESKDGETESPIVSVGYAQEKTPAIDSKTIIATDNVDFGDTVEIKSGLTTGEVVNVYSKAGTKLGAGKANASGAVKVVLGAKSFNEDDKEIEVSGIAPGAAESDKVAASYAAEDTTTISDSLKDANITKNVTKADTLAVPGVAQNGIISVYGPTGALIGSGKQLKTDGSDVTITFAKALTVGDKITVKVKEPNKKISAGKELVVPSAPETQTKLQGLGKDVIIKNNVDTPDTVTVLKDAKLPINSVVKVYSDSAKKTLLGTAAVTKLTEGKDLVVKLPKASTIGATGSATKLYITVIDSNCTEATPVELDCTGIDEATLKLDEKSGIVVKANISKPDQVTVPKGIVAKNGVVKLLASDGKTVLATAVCQDDTKDVVINLAKHLTDKTVNITVKNPEVLISNTLAVDVTAADETKTKLQGLGKDVTIQNNVDTLDTLTVSKTANLPLNAVVKVYSSSDKKKLLGTAAVTKLTEGKDLVIKLPKGSLTPVGKDTKLYITVTETNATETTPLELDCTGIDEATLTLDDKSGIVVKANVTKADQVTVPKGIVKKNGVVKVYTSDGKTVLGTAICRDETKDVVINLVKHLTVKSVAIEVKNPEVEASNKLAVDVTAADATTDVLQGTEAGDKEPADVTMQNNVDTPDTITIKAAGLAKLHKGDIIKVYDSKKDAKGNPIVLARLVVTQPLIDAKKDVVLRLPKSTTLDNDSDGQLTITVTSLNATESNPSVLKYAKADVTADIASGELLAASNALMVTNVKTGDRVFVYDSDPSTNKTAKLVGSGLAVGKNNYVFVSFKAQTSTYFVVKKSNNEKISANAVKVSIDQQGKATITYAGA